MVTDAQLAAELNGRSGWSNPVSAGTTGEDGTLLLTNLDLSLIHICRLKQIIRETDPAAFVMVTEATEVFGEGFKEIID